MKKRIVAAALLLALCMTLLTGCSWKKNWPWREPNGAGGKNPTTYSAAEKEVELCFIAKEDQAGGPVVRENRTIQYDSSKGLEPYVLRELFNGPKNVQAANVIPGNLGVKSITKNQGVVLVTLKFTDDTTPENFDFMLIETSISLTLLGLEGVEKVGVYMNEVERDSEGNPQGLISREDVAVSSQTSEANSRNVTLYLPDVQSNQLVPEVRTIVAGSEVSVINSIVTEIFKTTTNQNNIYQMVYNQNARLLSVVIEGETAYLNFSEGIEGKNATQEQINLCIYGIVNSICRAEEISSVKLWVKGKDYDAYQKFTKYNSFLPNENLVQMAEE